MSRERAGGRAPPARHSPARELLAWHATHARDLPWRRARTPWGTLVSEVMLQQTQVARVAGRWERFLERFPDEHALAAASGAELLAEWSGLGYNRRALRLRDAARAIAERGWPRTAAGLRELPGVGEYTAAAVASLAFGEQVAALDVNARRVIERHDGERRAPAALARRAEELLPPRRARDWNEALMDLGATVCTARRARCGQCPLRGCVSRDAAPEPPPARERRERFADSDRYARGRIVAALAAGAPLPAGLGAERVARALAALERDGLVVRGPAGPRLPA